MTFERSQFIFAILDIKCITRNSSTEIPDQNDFWSSKNTFSSSSTCLTVKRPLCDWSFRTPHSYNCVFKFFLYVLKRTWSHKTGNLAAHLILLTPALSSIAASWSHLLPLGDQSLNYHLCIMPCILLLFSLFLHKGLIQLLSTEANILQNFYSLAQAVNVFI